MRLNEEDKSFIRSLLEETRPLFDEVQESLRQESPDGRNGMQKEMPAA